MVGELGVAGSGVGRVSRMMKGLAEVVVVGAYASDTCSYIGIIASRSMPKVVRRKRCENTSKKSTICKTSGHLKSVHGSIGHKGKSTRNETTEYKLASRRSLYRSIPSSRRLL